MSKTQKAPRLIRLGELEAIEVPCDQPGARTVVCLHGYGADMHDLVPLAAELETAVPLRWLFPNAPLRLDFGGRAWFPIDVAAFEEAQRTGRPRDLSKREPTGMADARTMLEAFLGALGAPLPNLVLMGFSQGAMMAVDLAARAPTAPAGVAVLSGTLVDAASLRTLAPSKSGLRFFQSHGSVDPILGFSAALALERELKAAGWRGGLLRFEGGHGIPAEVASALTRWLNEL